VTMSPSTPKIGVKIRTLGFPLPVSPVMYAS
jgi:hypothetical protein